MNCKHCNDKNYCTIFNKAANEISCRKCMMRIPKNDFASLFGNVEGFGDVFEGFRK